MCVAHLCRSMQVRVWMRVICYVLCTWISQDIQHRDINLCMGQSVNYISIKKAGLDVTLSHPLCRMHFGQHQPHQLWLGVSRRSGHARKAFMHMYMCVSTQVWSLLGTAAQREAVPLRRFYSMYRQGQPPIAAYCVQESSPISSWSLQRSLWGLVLAENILHSE